MRTTTRLLLHHPRNFATKFYITDPSRTAALAYLRSGQLPSRRHHDTRPWVGGAGQVLTNEPAGRFRSSREAFARGRHHNAFSPITAPDNSCHRHGCCSFNRRHSRCCPRERSPFPPSHVVCPVSRFVPVFFRLVAAGSPWRLPLAGKDQYVQAWIGRISRDLSTVPLPSRSPISNSTDSWAPQVRSFSEGRTAPCGQFRSCSSFLFFLRFLFLLLSGSLLTAFLSFFLWVIF